MGERIGRGIASLRVGRIFSRQGGIGVRNPHDEVPASSLTGQQVPQVVVVENLKAAVDYACRVHHKDPSREKLVQIESGKGRVAG